MPHTVDETRPSYAPRGLHTDATALGLRTTTVRSPFGSCIAHHPPVRSSIRATIFLHGAAGSWTTWTPLIATASAKRIDLGDTVLLDLPGWGGASLSHPDGSADDNADRTMFGISSLVRELAEQLGYTEWDLVGHSLGGFVALHMASLWPECVLSVGLVSATTFSVIHSIEHPLTRFGELPGFTMLWRVMQFLELLGSTGRSLVRGLGTVGLLGPLTSPLFRHWRSIPRSQVVALADEVRPRSFATAAAAIRGYNADARWSKIQCPVRATKGDRDVFVTDADLAHLGGLLPGSIRSVIDDCGHFGTVERPDAVLVALGYVPTI